MNRNIERVIHKPLGARDPLPQSNQIEWAGKPIGHGINSCRNGFFSNFKINVVFISLSPTELPVKMNSHSPEKNMFHRIESPAQPGKPVETQANLKLVEFSLVMLKAKTVQLAADFTDWDAAPIDMIRFGDGVWSTTVPLPPGTYAYRFLVDGNWYDDPRSVKRHQGATGAAEAFVKIN